MRALAFAALAICVSFAAAADEVRKPEYFFGRYVGGAEIQGGEGLTARRQSEVEITPYESGFEITWTTLSLDPSEPGGVSVKTATEQFDRTDNAAVFHAENSGALLKGEPVTWARIDGDTLTMTTITVSEKGGYDVASWARTVSGDDMKLVFTRFRDGELVRKVEGDLVRIDALDEN